MKELHFLSLKEANGRTVSFAISSKTPGIAQLLGVLPHLTQFKRSDLETFAKDILNSWEPRDMSYQALYRRGKEKREKGR